MPTAVALPYRLYFLYFEPIMTLSGAYLCLFSPLDFLARATPLDVTTVTPLTHLLLTQIACLYIFHGFTEAIILRLSNDARVWRTLAAGIAIADLGHLYSLYAAAPRAFVNVPGWTRDEWINYGILTLGLALRIGMLLGVGIGKGTRKPRSVGRVEMFK
ncbi:MAG: hypothetical protein M1818_001504 [Claussenomyces sp. TS43310]|nr:MAG: hypothetical protein M1818_001504 [Claussenomyces sp. TS43310]